MSWSFLPRRFRRTSAARASWSTGAQRPLGHFQGDSVGRLAAEKCVACHRDAPTVTDDELVELLPQVPDWELVEVDGVPRLQRVFELDDFAAALAFTNRVGVIADAEGHHPALLTEWGRVTVSWWTHKIRGLHRNDFVMAAKTDALYGGG